MPRMDQYAYCAELAAEYTPEGGVALDYGCGSGQIVAKLLAHAVTPMAATCSTAAALIRVARMR